ncbi:hypothetical protein N7501_004214 [Penicillium viridicatum]|nr:hypothetical protein N7501_004214 [Penicillium viridicatum]
MVRQLREKVKGGLLKGSYCWIFENDDFKEWHFKQENQLLWIKGDLGKVLRVIYILVDNQSNLISHVRRQHDKTGEKGFEDANAWETLSKIFSDILKDPLLQSTYVIIDALDGCTKDRDLLLGLIAQKSSEYQRVKWIVSSRSWPDIEEALEPGRPKIEACLHQIHTIKPSKSGT